MTKPTIRLYDSVGTGLIIECGSGVIVSNQTGGTSCLHPELEGIFVPLANDYSESTGRFISPEIELCEYFTGAKYSGAGATSGIDDDDAQFIESILKRVGLYPVISVSRQRLKDSHEAWIHVEISGDEHAEPSVSTFLNFAPYPRRGILTWSNSD